jgi:aminopeptidase
MQHQLLNKYAHLLVNYCVRLQANERLYIETSTLAEPLVREIHRETLRAGGTMCVNFEFRDQKSIQWQEANEQQLSQISPLYKEAMDNFDAYINIRAPFYPQEIVSGTAEQQKKVSQSTAIYRQRYAERTANLSLKRNLCEFPTIANAQNAGLTLEEYADFITNACFLNQENPAEHWLKISHEQQKVVNFLSKKTKMRYKNANMEVEFSTKGRTWINSDGKTNMPSGEVYTSPVENSVNGKLHFDLPSIYNGQEAEGITLWVENGEIQRWEAKKGQAVLDKIFAVQGARQFGEAAIGCNYNIQKAVKNILFDEKIGGTVHLAVGQSYLQAGGKNQSAVHWDMIASMQDGGEIYADDEKIYENGKFLFL